MNLIEIRREFKYEFNSLPDFIDTTSEIHLLLWDSMCDCNNIVMNLILDKVLKESSIIVLTYKFDDYFQDCLNIVDNMEVELSVYYSVIFGIMMARTLEEELYESTSNLKRFTSLYYKMLCEKSEEI